MNDNHPARSSRTISDSRLSALVVAAVFVLWGLWRLSHHEMWRDEVGVWLHLRHAESFSVLLKNLDYGGHPVLWPLLVYPLACLSSDPFLMQYLHLVVATSSVFLVVRHAPFTVAEKLLLVFGYYLSFEYTVITRQYALSVLLLLGHLSFRASPRASTIPAALCLALLAETSVHGAILAVAMLAGWLLKGGMPHRSETGVGGRPGWREVAVVLTGIVIAIVDMNPPADYGFARQWVFNLEGARLWATLAKVWTALFPVPVLHAGFWNSNVLDGYPVVATAAGLLVLTICLWSWRRQRAPVVSLAVASAGLLAFFYTKHMGGQRHHGFIFLAVLAGYWLYRRAADGLSRGEKAFRAWVWIPILLIHALVAFYASYMDYRLPFSGSRAAVEYLRAFGLDDRPIAVYPLERVKPVAVLLDRDLYHLGSGAFEKYAVFNQRSYVKLKAEEIALGARKWLDETNGQGIIILSEGFKLPPKEFHLLAKIPETAIVNSERYSIYAANDE